MIVVSILYPATAGARFDFAYYVDQHMPLSVSLLGAHPGFRRVSVSRGVGGAVPGSPPRYVASCQYEFDSVESFLAAFTPNAAVLQGDMARYTDIAPEIQFNDVLIIRP